MIKTGIFGGTFDPFHLGHLALSKAFINEIQLDELFIIPAANTPLKDAFIFSYQQRMTMANLALKEIKKAFVSDLDNSVELIRRFKEKYKDRQIYFAIGEDNVAQLKDWKDYQKLFEIAKIVVFTRNTPTRKLWDQLDYLDKLSFVKMPAIDISSTEIRQKLINNEDVSLFLPKHVNDYISSLKQFDNINNFLLDQKHENK